MEHVAFTTILVLTLSQLCRAEISQILPGPWFSANTFNDEFSPKPISEIFTSTESPANAATGSQTFPVTQPTFSVTQSQSTISEQQSQSSFSVTDPIIVLSPVSSPAYPSSNHAQSTSSLFQSFSSSNPLSTPLPTFSQDLSSIRFTPSTGQTPIFLDASSFTRLPKETPTVNIIPLPPSSTPLPTFATQFPATPSASPPSSIVVFRDPPSNTPTDITSTISTSSPTNSPFSTNSPISTSSSISVTSPRLTTVSSSYGSTTDTPSIAISTATSLFTSPIPICLNSTIYPTMISSTLSNRPLSTRLPGLVIRVVAPKGSITNVKINPTTSTQRPRTKRTSKPKRNTYDGCIQACRGRKDILCSIPLSSTTIDPKELKSFPSICHMACHNSYRTPAYEMLVEGRCSRLRTRIMTIDSNKKLKREELKKSEYSIVNTGEGTVVEFANGYIRK